MVWITLFTLGSAAVVLHSQEETIMTQVGTRDVQPLNWDVLVTPAIPIVTSDLPPGVKQAMFQAMASTLIYGKRDAVLVDAFMTVKQADDLVDWVAASGKNLTTIYITHGHGDHWFGIGALLERFPNARAVARPDVVKVMRRHASPEVLAGVWKAAFPGQIPDRIVIAEELKGNVINLEGNELDAVELGHTDTDYTTCLNVPSIGLVVAGDAAYNDVHLYLVESNAKSRQEWISALDKIESLKPQAVIASHKRPGSDDNPTIIEQTRQYIRDFDRLVETATTAQELYDKMLELYPNRVNPGWALWNSARAVKQ
jgi:glyoxylase-like metal-dependent hydrolase (beta-lactamase superfamily II)